MKNKIIIAFLLLAILFPSISFAQITNSNQEQISSILSQLRNILATLVYKYQQIAAVRLSNTGLIPPTLNIQILSPVVGEAWTRGEQKIISWSNNPPNHTGNVDITLRCSTPNSPNNFSIYSGPISSVTPTAYPWTVGNFGQAGECTMILCFSVPNQYGQECVNPLGPIYMKEKFSLFPVNPIPLWVWSAGEQIISTWYQGSTTPAHNIYHSLVPELYANFSQPSVSYTLGHTANITTPPSFMVTDSKTIPSILPAGNYQYRIEARDYMQRVVDRDSEMIYVAPAQSPTIYFTGSQFEKGATTTWMSGTQQLISWGSIGLTSTSTIRLQIRNSYNQIVQSWFSLNDGKELITLSNLNPGNYTFRIIYSLTVLNDAPISIIPFSGVAKLMVRAVYRNLLGNNIGVQGATVFLGVSFNNSYFQQEVSTGATGWTPMMNLLPGANYSYRITKSGYEVKQSSDYQAPIATSTANHQVLLIPIP
ncbi:MAG: hypothetical protein AAB453_01820 [Patescibacteria group bacterium]